ncbi:NADPH-dependent diflavin oxidoreductase 1 isoform X2 [Aphidius gifuensis]|nr:NADPH-dependent diflavin oxidoreductase 1 isoform X2 [Aphidius gifuensis]
MRKFWRYMLNKKLPNNLLENINYGVIGLGDSSYEKYNYAAKKLNNRLLQLGAKQIIPIGLADDQHDLGIDAIIIPWVKKLWDSIQIIFNVSLSTDHNNDNLIERFDVKILPMNKETSKNINKKYRDIHKEEIKIIDRMKIATVSDNIRTTSHDHFQDVRLIKLKLNNIDYLPGDLIYIKPKNSIEQINNFFELLKDINVPLYPEMIIKIIEKEINIPVCLKISDLTLYEIVEQYWDLNYKPRRSTMKILASIADDELEKEKLTEFSLSIGQDELYNYVNRPRRNIIEVLNDFPHTKKKLNEKILFEIMSPIKPRAFSIASSNKHSNNEIHVLVAVVKYKTKLITPRLGLCSNWLASLKYNDEIVCWLQKGTFKFAIDKPMILIASGTGVAAFRSLLLDCAAKNYNLNNTCMFFGCRYKVKDYHCQDEFELLQRENNLRVFCAFSRDQPEKRYVQHAIRAEGQLCWNLLEQGGQIYLSGSSKNMPKCVRDEFIDIAKNYGHLSTDEAEEFIIKLEKSGRYQTETWS